MTSAWKLVAVDLDRPRHGLPPATCRAGALGGEPDPPGTAGRGVRDRDGQRFPARTGPRDRRAAHITHSSVADSLVETMAIGVDKGAALSTVVANLGLAATSVIAFGDMPNDIEMLTWAGRGYAADGVARVLEQLLESPAFA